MLLYVFEHHRQVLHDVLLARLVDPEYLRALVEQFAGEADVYGRLHAVAREHPELDAGLPDRSDRVGDSVLQLVFNGSRSQKSQVSFDFGDYVSDLECLVVDGSLGLLKFVDPTPVEVL
jgi:hypothetical protein